MRENFINTSPKTILIHVLGWFGWLSLILFIQPPTLPSQVDFAHYQIALKYLNIITSVILIVIFYLNALLLIPSLLYKRKILQYLFAKAFIFVFYIMFSHFIFDYCTKKFGVGNDPQPFELPMPLIVFPLFFNVIISSAYRYISDTIKKEKLHNEREKEGLKSELLFLKSQVSPHFVFNVLNNMVSLARKKSDALEPALMQLSTLLRYMLYDTDEDKVPLAKEVAYIENYIDLQKLRYENYVRVNTFINVDEKHLHIAPMLLIPFVENAFKHGTSFVENGFIKVELTTNNNQLHFTVVNRCQETEIGHMDKNSGIGLANVKRRLSLLYYNKYELSIEPDKKNNIFMVTLKINLLP